MRGETKKPAGDLLAVAQGFLRSRAGGSPAAIQRPSVADMMSDPEAQAGDPYAGLARLGGRFVQRGYDGDGLMYAVEVAFYVRESSADTFHPGSFERAPAHAQAA